MVCINGVVASAAVTEFMVAVTGLREPKMLMRYYGHMGPMAVPAPPLSPDCYYCKAIRGQREGSNVERYIAAGVGRWLR